MRRDRSIVGIGRKCKETELAKTYFGSVYAIV
jgi:hypothetical protein